MHTRVLRRAAAAAFVVLLATTVAALADTVPADGDSVASGDQNLVSLGVRGPGEVVDWNVGFRLSCGGSSHAPVGSTIAVAFSSATVPLDGAATATSTSIGPVPANWPAPGAACSSPAPTLASDGPSVVELRMPTTPGTGYRYSLLFAKSGASGVIGLTFMTFAVDVVANTKPHLTVPSDLTIEATGASGAVATFSATATDAEDATAPTPGCTPASGSTFPLGTTTVNCTVTDGGGLSDSGSFHVTVADTIAPSLVGMPADMSLTTGNAGGTTLTYTAPTATDAVDPAPTVACAPASGSAIPVGATTVTCTATDAAGNHSSASFSATVTFVSPVAWSAVWGEPVATPGDTYATNGSRTIPVKVEIFSDGVEQTSGSAVLSVVGCDGGTPWTMALTWDAGRWNGHLDTSRLGGPGCYRVSASLDGNAAGSFRLDVRGDAPAATSNHAAVSGTAATSTGSTGAKGASGANPKAKTKP
jgi:hypothetical protein